MAASGYTPIQLYRTATASTSPTSGNLNAGELAINYNTADMSVWALNTSGSVVRIMNNPAGLKYPTVDGSADQFVKTDGSGNLGWATAGYKNIPQTGSDKTTAYTLVTGDVGKYVGVGSGGSIVIPVSIFSNGDAISVFNNTTGNITFDASAVGLTAYIGGDNTDRSSITLATRGISTILFISGSICVVSGNVS